MKILFITGSFPNIKDGIGDNAERLYNEFIKREDVYLLTTLNDDVVKFVTKNEYKNVFYLNNWKLRLKTLVYIKKLVDDNKVDIVYIEYPGKGYGKDILINVVPIYLRVFGKNVKVNMRYHEYSNSRLLRKIVDVPLLLGVHKLFIPSYIDYKLLKKVFPKKSRKVYIGASIDGEKAIVQRKRDKNEFIIGYFGFVYPGKGIERLLMLFSKLVQIDSNIKLVMMCDLDKNNSYHNDILNMIDRLNICENVTITGYLELNDLKNMFKKIDLAMIFFDDGLTLRRSSIINCIFQGVPIVSSCGDKECNHIFNKDKDIFMSDNDNEIIEYVFKIKNDNYEYENRCNNIAELCRYFKWDDIATGMLQEFKN